MGKARRKRVKKVFGAKFNASRVNVGQSVRTFLTSPKTGEIKGHYPEVFHYRVRGSTAPREWLEALFSSHRNWKSNTAWAEKMQKYGLEINPHAEVRKRKKLLKEKEEEPKSVLSLLDLYNQEVNAELVQTSWRHQNIERFWFIKLYHWDKDCRLRLYLSRNEYFFVEENIKLRQLRKTCGYASKDRAMQVYEHHEFHWVEVFTITDESPS